MQHFGCSELCGLDPHTVEGLMHLLDECNELVGVFRTARDKCNEQPVLDFKIRLYSVVGAQEDDLLTSQTLGAIVFEIGHNTKANYDVIIESKDGFPQRINKLHSSYMSLQFPLLFIYGQPGFHTEMKKRTTNGKKRLSMNMFYMYQLHERFDSYGLLFRAGRLFQHMEEYPGLLPEDRADIVVRVFQQKVNDFCNYLIINQIFGSVTGLLYTIEFQKRGLPDCHTLLWVDNKDKIQHATDVERYTSAKLPDPKTDPDGYRVVSEMMVHGPCVPADPNASCMKEGECNKNFPKKFNRETFLIEMAMFTTVEEIPGLKLLEEIVPEQPDVCHGFRTLIFANVLRDEKRKAHLQNSVFHPNVLLYGLQAHLTLQQAL
nr:helitron helicase-like domain-containing protein [Tanacetum cinerariifolium]